MPRLPLTPLVRAEVERRFAPADAGRAIALLEATPLPFLDVPDRARERQRVQLAALKHAEGDLVRLEQAAKEASRDWRDLLAVTGLADADWPEVLRRAGFPVPE